ncbi:MAG: 50S ribosomal protein L21 [Oligoflexales bacterium]|nr:50S ribosomal protein L21 [Oligoflexales bacterium]
MYAVIKAGAHQYRVKEGDSLRIDKVDGAAGDTIQFDKVLMVSGGEQANVGAPYLESASVEAVITEQTRDPKIIVFKFKRRKNYKKKRGHKQPVTVVEIKKINA